jgi:hypothetical protein
MRNKMKRIQKPSKKVWKKYIKALVKSELV